MDDPRITRTIREPSERPRPPRPPRPSLSGGPQNQESRFTPIDFPEFCKMKIEPRAMLMKPILREKGALMIFSYRGVGKTHVGAGIAYAAASGTKFLKWEAPKPYRVLLIDGEMPAADLQERYKAIVAGQSVVPAPGMFQILAADQMDFGIGNLADPKIQKEISQLVGALKTSLLILDNLSSLAAVIRDSDQESWNTIQAWILELRRCGVAVIILHHAGKSGEQRGTSRREDVLDTSVKLCHPVDYLPSEGARFEVHIEKGRGLHGDDAKPFEARLSNDGRGAYVWTVKELDDVNKSRVATLMEDGLSVRDIAEETGLSKSTVQRLKTQIEVESKAANEAATRPRSQPQG